MALIFHWDLTKIKYYFWFVINDMRFLQSLYSMIQGPEVHYNMEMKTIL